MNFFSKDVRPASRSWRSSQQTMFPKGATSGSVPDFRESRRGGRAEEDFSSTPPRRRDRPSNCIRLRPSRTARRNCHRGIGRAAREGAAELGTRGTRAGASSLPLPPAHLEDSSTRRVPSLSRHAGIGVSLARPPSSCRNNHPETRCRDPEPTLRRDRDFSFPRQRSGTHAAPLRSRPWSRDHP